MSDEFFAKEWLKHSEYPSDFIPAGGKILIGIDESQDGDCTVIGFYKDGVFHVQEIIHVTHNTDLSGKQTRI